MADFREGVSGPKDYVCTHPRHTGNNILDISLQHVMYTDVPIRERFAYEERSTTQIGTQNGHEQPPERSHLSRVRC